MRIILASESPRRKELLGRIVCKFEVVKSDYEEDNNLDMTPEALCLYHAEGKAREVAHRFRDAVVIGADTFVVHEGRILGKPGSKEGIVEMLMHIRGQEVDVFTGVCIIQEDKCKKHVEKTVIKMTDISDEDIRRYAENVEGLDKAGGFAAQGLGSIFIERIDGCYYNVIGLPLHRVYVLLKDFGVDVLCKRQ
ncbi:septum formation protein Maf [Candidatus Woesearchaeota archaeon]|nr:septum formation protein Maf [Candidatus Woesearchaeota archaeon]